MKLYVISGLGANRKVFERISFPENLEVIFIDWLIPYEDEKLSSYVERMAENINKEEPFYLLGYSFGGIIAQEIDKKYPAQKIVILASIRSEKEKSKLMYFAKFFNLHKRLKASYINRTTTNAYIYIRKKLDSKNPKLLECFRVRDPYYLKWGIEKVVDWESEKNEKVVQVLGEKDIVFPLSRSKPKYVIKGGTHLFPVTKARELSEILRKEFSGV